MAVVDRRFQLANGGDAPGLKCTPEGLSLAGAPLLRKTAAGLAPRPIEEIDALLKAAYGQDADPVGLAPGLDVVAKALNQGDLGRAMVAALHLRLPDIGPDDAERIAKADDALAKYDPGEPRDQRGRWTTGGAARSADPPAQGQARTPDRAGSSGRDQPLPIPVSDKAYPNVTAFRNQHLADAIKLAAVIGHGATADEVLAVAGNESTYGNDYKAQKYGNFFGIHSLGASPSKFYSGQTGTFYTSKGKLMAEFAPNDAFYRSGLIFAKTMATVVGNNDLSKPQIFLTLAHSHGWGADTEDYISTLMNVYGLFRNSARHSERRS